MAEDEWLGSITDSMTVNLSKLWEIKKHREAWHAAVHGITKSWTCLSDCTTILFFGLLYKIHLTHKSSLNLALTCEMKIQLVPRPQITRVI